MTDEELENLRKSFEAYVQSTIKWPNDPEARACHAYHMTRKGDIYQGETASVMWAAYQHGYVKALQELKESLKEFWEKVHDVQ